MLTFYGLQAGTAVADITPDLGISLAGGLTDRKATSILGPLHVRVVVLESAGIRIAFVLLELIALNNEDAARIRDVIGKAANLPAEHICVSCVHNHFSPCTLTLFQSVREAAFVEMVIHRVAEAVEHASQNMQPARAAWDNGGEPRAGFNRRYHLADGTVNVGSGIGKTKILRRSGPTDPQIPMLMIESLTGKPMAVIANYSLHYVGCDDSKAVSSDYFGVFAEIMRARKGQDFVALLTHGASGDINNVDALREPLPKTPGERCCEIAGWIADQVDFCWTKAKFQAVLPVFTTQDVYMQKVRKPKESEVEDAKKQLENASTPLIERLYAQEMIELLKWPNEIPMVIQSLRIGDFAASTFPGEMFCRFGLDLKHASPFPVTAFIELANGFGGYTPTRTDYDLGGYEIRVARSAFAAPFTGEEMVVVAAMQLRKLWRQTY